jgi:16S rRNA (guanine527-N7)-methyltransferase
MMDVRPTAKGLNVSRETFDCLATYVALIQKWSPTINLVSKSSLPQIWTRHIIDSVQVSEIVATSVDTWVDLGSGGGLPGMVVSILRPNTAVTLIESDTRKATFLRTCIRELGLNARVVAQRIEIVKPLAAQVVSARALAPLPQLLDLAQRHLAPEGIAILPKGRTAEEELAEAHKTWSFDYKLIKSQTDPNAKILRIERITRA